ncbi:MAG TPA: PQQ-dependent sugar dehydrogenase [Gammaproteobacteria bacterium]
MESEQQRFRLRIVTENLEHPWGMAFLPDGRMLVTERPGRLRVISKQGVLQPEPVKNLPAIVVEGQGGLLDVVLDPAFTENRLIYFSYAAAGEGGLGTEVARARFADTTLQDVKVIFRALPKTAGGQHFGSRLVFDKKGYLFITLGERNQREEAQRLENHLGSIIRIHADGRVPADNPFVTRKGAKPENYTYGNRNVQGAALHPATGEIWTHEHGPQGGDEINIVEPGANYGWPVITYGRNYVTGTAIGEGTAKAGMKQPLYYWDPSIAPSGMAFYSGDAFPNWRGDLFVGSLKFGLLVRLKIEKAKVTHEERLFKGMLGRIRDVRIGPDGFIYVLTDEGRGKLARLESVDL